MSLESGPWPAGSSPSPLPDGGAPAPHPGAKQPPMGQLMVPSMAPESLVATVIVPPAPAVASPGDVRRNTVVLPPQCSPAMAVAATKLFRERRDILLPAPMWQVYQFPAMRSTRLACALA